MPARRIGVANDEYQQLSALRTNRKARARHGAVLVEGVQPITMAVDAGWPVRSWLWAEGGRRSDWAQRVV